MHIDSFHYSHLYSLVGCHIYSCASLLIQKHFHFHLAFHMAYNTMAQGFLYQRSEGEDIDLGLSLCPSLQQESFHQPSGRFLSPSEYGVLMGWPQLQPFLRSSNIIHSPASEDDDDVTQMVQSKERRFYVKVNMEGVVIGRKICVFDHTNYSSLALELEEMFGQYCGSGLRLLKSESSFSLLYEDKNENWRTVGDIPWMEFVDCVKRLRIGPKDQAPFQIHLPSSNNRF